MRRPCLHQPASSLHNLHPPCKPRLRERHLLLQVEVGGAEGATALEAREPGEDGVRVMVVALETALEEAKARAILEQVEGAASVQGWVGVATEAMGSVGVAAMVRVVPVAVAAKVPGESVTVEEAGWAVEHLVVADQTVAGHNRPLLASVARQAWGSHRSDWSRRPLRST